MPQTLFPAAFPEGITFIRTHAGLNTIHIGELPGGGYSRIDGQPIQSIQELTDVIPKGPRLKHALEWWAHRDEPEPDEEPPAVTWRRGKLIYVDSGVELTSHAEIIQAFPEESPMQRAALEWFGQSQARRHQANERQDLATGVIGGQGQRPAVEAGPTERSGTGQFVKRTVGRPPTAAAKKAVAKKVQVRTPLNTA